MAALKRLALPLLLLMDVITTSLQLPTLQVTETKDTPSSHVTKSPKQDTMEKSSTTYSKVPASDLPKLYKTLLSNNQTSKDLQDFLNYNKSGKMTVKLIYKKRAKARQKKNETEEPSDIVNNDYIQENVADGNEHWKQLFSNISDSKNVQVNATPSESSLHQDQSNSIIKRILLRKSCHKNLKHCGRNDKSQTNVESIENMNGAHNVLADFLHSNQKNNNYQSSETYGTLGSISTNSVNFRRNNNDKEKAFPARNTFSKEVTHEDTPESNGFFYNVTSFKLIEPNVSYEYFKPYDTYYELKESSKENTEDLNTSSAYKFNVNKTASRYISTDKALLEDVYRIEENATTINSIKDPNEAMEKSTYILSTNSITNKDKPENLYKNPNFNISTEYVASGKVSPENNFEQSKHLNRSANFTENALNVTSKNKMLENNYFDHVSHGSNGSNFNDSNQINANSILLSFEKNKSNKLANISNDLMTTGKDDKTDSKVENSEINLILKNRNQNSQPISIFLTGNKGMTNKNVHVNHISIENRWKHDNVKNIPGDLTSINYSFKNAFTSKESAKENQNILNKKKKYDSFMINDDDQSRTSIQLQSNAIENANNLKQKKESKITYSSNDKPANKHLIIINIKDPKLHLILNLIYFKDELQANQDNQETIPDQIKGNYVSAPDDEYFKHNFGNNINAFQSGFKIPIAISKQDEIPISKQDKNQFLGEKRYKSYENSLQYTINTIPADVTSIESSYNNSYTYEESAEGNQEDPNMKIESRYNMYLEPKNSALSKTVTKKEHDQSGTSIQFKINYNETSNYDDELGVKKQKKESHTFIYSPSDKAANKHQTSINFKDSKLNLYLKPINKFEDKLSFPEYAPSFNLKTPNDVENAYALPDYGFQDYQDDQKTIPDQIKSYYVSLSHDRHSKQNLLNNINAFQYGFKIPKWNEDKKMVLKVKPHKSHENGVQHAISTISEDLTPIDDLSENAYTSEESTEGNQEVPNIKTKSLDNVHIKSDNGNLIKPIMVKGYDQPGPKIQFQSNSNENNNYGLKLNKRKPKSNTITYSSYEEAANSPSIINSQNLKLNLTPLNKLDDVLPVPKCVPTVD